MAIHAHFYQPERRDPFGAQIPLEPAATPFANWNERITEECYRPNAERGNFDRISFDVGPTLAVWLASHAPEVHARIVAADRPAQASPPRLGNALAQAYHHSILPLASIEDRRTEIRWGLRDFEIRFGRRAEGFWLPETAVDLVTIRLLADEGVRFTILAPWQAADAPLDSRRLHRAELGDGRLLVVAFFDADLSAAVSFQPAATADADTFLRDRLTPRLATSRARTEPSLVLVATDGELYGHHQVFRDLFLERLTTRIERHRSGRGGRVALVDLARFIHERDPATLPAFRLRERTSWSCRHGLVRWSGECACVAESRWKAPLRTALDRLAGGIDGISETLVRGLGRGADLWAARDAYISVVAAAEAPEEFAQRHLGHGARATERAKLFDLLEAQRMRLQMFASDGWFWEDPDRGETRQILRFAARAARLVDAAAGTRLESRLVEDLRALSSPKSGRDGAAIYRNALAEVDGPAP